MQRREFLASLPVIMPMTPSEITAMKWGDVHLEKKRISVPQERPIEQRLIMQLWSMQDVCEEAILQTCAGCQRTVKDRGCCMECEDLDALHWTIRNFRTIFESQVVGFPELRERWKSERRA